MGFIDSYKHLEKLCGDVLGDERRVSAYIDEMLNLPHGTYLVTGWNEDLKTLKHYRWVRNRIVHDPGCTEENMCEPGDALWLDNFYSRIMNQTDPLALYHKAIRQRPAQKPKPVSTIYTYSQQGPRAKKNNNKSVGFVAFLVGALLLIVAIIFISKVL